HREHQLADQREGRADAVAVPGPDQAQLLDVARHRGLSRGQAERRECGGELLLGVEWALPDQLQDSPLPGPFHHGAWARFSAAAARSISSAVMTSGGTRRTVSSSTALTITPSARQRDWKSLATGCSKTQACIRPRPRTSLTPLKS